MATNPRDPAEEHKELFRTGRRYSSPDFNPAANNHVRTVSDDGAENWATIREQVTSGLLGYIPGVSQAFVRDSLRSASRGLGRGRDRR